MTKTSGLGDNLYVAGYDLSGDIGSVQNIHGGPTALEVTAINASAPERIGGLLDGGLDFNAWYDYSAAHEHVVLSALPTTDVHVMYLRGTTLGNPAVGLLAKQVNYDPTRGADGSLTFAVNALANAYGIEWGVQLTAGLRTDTSATNGTAVDGLAESTTGWSAYLQVIDVTGTNVVVTLEDSANNTDFAVFTSSAFTSATADRTTQRIAGAAGATVRRYVRAVTSGTFSSATFAVAFTRHPSGAAT